MFGPFGVEVIASAKGAVDVLIGLVLWVLWVRRILLMKRAEFCPGDHFAVTEFRGLEVPRASREGLE